MQQQQNSKLSQCKLKSLSLKLQFHLPALSDFQNLENSYLNDYVVPSAVLEHLEDSSTEAFLKPMSVLDLETNTLIEQDGASFWEKLFNLMRMKFLGMLMKLSV